MVGEGPLWPQARELLAREREQREDEALKARALSRARAVLQHDRPSGVALRRASVGPSGAAPRRLLRTLLVAAAIGVASLAAAGVAVFVLNNHERAAPPAPMPKQLPAPASVVPDLDDSALGPVVTPPSATPVLGPRPAPVATAVEGFTARAPSLRQFQTERMLLEPARTAISRGDYAAALAAVAKHRRDFPNGELAEERDALRVRALWGAGQKVAATTAAKASHKRYPRSALLSWLKAEDQETP